MPELKHYGILGMRWGIRRFQNKDGTLTAAGKERYSDEGDKKESAEEKTDNATSQVSKDKYGLSEMSDADLQKKINRLNMEQNYKRLVDQKDPNATQENPQQKQQVFDVDKLRTMNISDLSTSELQAVVNRLNLESQYANLIKPENVNAGKKFVDKVLGLTKDVAGGMENVIKIKKSYDTIRSWANGKPINNEPPKKK